MVLGAFHRLRTALLGGVRLTRRGSAFLIAGVLGYAIAFGSATPILLYIATVCVTLPLLAVVFVRTRQSALVISRRFSQQVIEAGATTAVTLRVDNSSARSTVRMQWRDVLPWKPWLTERGWLPRLAPKSPAGRDKSAAQLSYALSPQRRGVFEIGPLALEITDAFDMAWGSWNVGSTTPLIVTPQVHSLTTTGLSSQSGDGEARVVQRRAAGDDDDVMTREYRRGDAMRRVHWKASARHGSLMVRQEEQHSYPEARIIVDTRVEGYPDASRAVTRSTDGREVSESHSARFEWVVAMLASAAVQLRREGFLVQIVETGASQLTDAATLHRRSAAEQELLTRLATFTPTQSAAQWWGRGVSGTAGRGPLIALVAAPEPETIDFLIGQNSTKDLATAFIVEAPAGRAWSERFGAAQQRPARTVLEEAGWLVIPVQSFDDISDVWNEFVAATRVTHELD